MQIIILEEVRDFLEEIDPNSRSRVNRFMQMLKESGHLIKMPYSKNILPNIFELRVGGTQNIRVISCYYNSSAVIFHVFMKKTEQISLSEINTIKTKYNNLQI